MPSRANNKRLFPGKPVRNRSVPVFLCGESRAGYFACSHLWAYDISPDSIEKGELDQTLVNTIAPYQFESWNVEHLEELLDYTCLWDSRILAGSAFRHVKDFALLAESRFPMQATVSSEGGESRLDLVSCSTLDFMDDAQHR